MLSQEEIRTAVLQFTQGKIGLVASEDQVALAGQPSVPEESLESVDPEGLRNFLREFPDLTREWGMPEWVGIEFGGETLFLHPRGEIWVGVWKDGGLSQFASFQAFVQQRMPDFLALMRKKLLQDFEEILRCVRFLTARLEERWGKALVRLVFWFSLPPHLRRFVRKPEAVMEHENLSRKDLEQALQRALHRFVSRLSRAWGRETVRREILHALRTPHPDRPTGCVRERLQKFLPPL